MTSPYRITRPNARSSIISAEAPPAAVSESGLDFKGYLDRLMKLIPAEVVGLYLVGNGFIPAGQALVLTVWSIICLGGVIAIKAYGTADKANHKPIDWFHVAISAVSFVIWVYTIGGPFAAYHIASPYLGPLLILAWTFFVPIFYRGVAY